MQSAKPANCGEHTAQGKCDPPRNQGIRHYLRAVDQNLHRSSGPPPASVHNDGLSRWRLGPIAFTRVRVTTAVMG